MKHFLLISAFLLLAAGCSAGENYGAGVDEKAQLVTVKDVYLNQSIQNTLVNLEGTIISQCQSPDKCWYFMQDSTGRIFVNLTEGKFTMPAAIGKKAKVTGTIRGGADGYQIMAQGVKVY